MLGFFAQMKVNGLNTVGDVSKSKIIPIDFSSMGLRHYCPKIFSNIGMKFFNKLLFLDLVSTIGKAIEFGEEYNQVPFEFTHLGTLKA